MRVLSFLTSRTCLEPDGVGNGDRAVRDSTQSSRGGHAGCSADRFHREHAVRSTSPPEQLSLKYACPIPFHSSLPSSLPHHHHHHHHHRGKNHPKGRTPLPSMEVDPYASEAESSDNLDDEQEQEQEQPEDEGQEESEPEDVGVAPPPSVTLAPPPPPPPAPYYDDGMPFAVDDEEMDLMRPMMHVPAPPPPPPPPPPPADVLPPPSAGPDLLQHPGPLPKKPTCPLPPNFPPLAALLPGFRAMLPAGVPLPEGLDSGEEASGSSSSDEAEAAAPKRKRKSKKDKNNKKKQQEGDNKRKRNRQMGEWVEFEDPDTGRLYYQSTKTQQVCAPIFSVRIAFSHHPPTYHFTSLTHTPSPPPSHRYNGKRPSSLAAVSGSNTRRTKVRRITSTCAPRRQCGRSPTRRCRRRRSLSSSRTSRRTNGSARVLRRTRSGV